MRGSTLNIMKMTLGLCFGLACTASNLQAADLSHPLLNPIDGNPKPDAQMLIHQADLLPSGVYTLRRQAATGANGKGLPQKKPRRKLDPDSMAFEMNVER